MKKILVFWTFAAFLAGGVIWANDPPTTPPEFPAEVDGEANQAVQWQHGTDSIGGFSGSQSSGSFSAEGFCEPSGQATVFGKASGANNTGANFASSFSSGFSASGAEADGWLSKIELSGFSEQGNWATIGGSENGASGWGYSNAEYTGEKSSFWGAEGFGMAKSWGHTEVSVSETSNSKQAEARTTDGSFAYVSPEMAPTTSVSGVGGIDVWSVMESDTYFAGAGGTGYGRYDGAGGNFSAGFLDTCGITKTVVGASSVSASAHVESKVNITGGMCGGGPCYVEPPPELNQDCGGGPCH